MFKISLLLFVLCYAFHISSLLFSWSSLERGDEGLYRSNSQTNLVMALHSLSLLFFYYINTTAYHLGRYKPSFPSTKELHAFFSLSLFCFRLHHAACCKVKLSQDSRASLWGLRIFVSFLLTFVWTRLARFIERCW